MAFASGQEPTAAELNLATRKLIAYAERESNSSTTTTEVGVLRLDDIPLTAGHRYIIDTSSLALDGTTANDVIRASLRCTTDGTTPTTSSTVFAQSQELQANASFAVYAMPRASYTPTGSGELLSILLTVSRATGAGTVGMIGSSTSPIEIFVWDAGEDVGDTGVDI